jgi:hypothetical protein
LAMVAPTGPEPTINTGVCCISFMGVLVTG